MSWHKRIRRISRMVCGMVVDEYSEVSLFVGRVTMRGVDGEADMRWKEEGGRGEYWGWVWMERYAGWWWEWELGG